MKNIKTYLLAIYEFIFLYFLLNENDHFLGLHSSYYFNHDVLFFNLGMLLIIGLISLSIIKKINLIPSLYVVVVVSQILFIYVYALDKSISFKDVFIVSWGYLNALILFSSVLTNFYLSNIKKQNLSKIKIAIILICFVSSFLFMANMGWLADEYYDFKPISISWNILILSILNFYQLKDMKNI